MNNSRRGPWSPEEDQKLMELISIFGPTNWVRISNSLVSRSPKQCRERYHQNLKPSLNRTPISAEEGELIEQLVAKYGKKWAEIARHLNGRSDNAIKNWWNGGASKRRRASVQHDKDDPSGYLEQGGPKDMGSTGPTGSATATGSSGRMMPPPAPYMAQSIQLPPIPSQTLQPLQPLSTSNSGSISGSSGPGGSFSGSSGPGGQGQVPSGQYGQSTQPNQPMTGFKGNMAGPGLPQKEEDTRIAFNTSMFNNSNNSTDSLSPSRADKSGSFQGIRSASFDYSNGNVNYPSQLPPLINKRRLFDDPLPGRRHSTTSSINSIYSVPNGNNSYLTLSHTSSHNNLVSLGSNQANNGNGNGAQSPYNQSPLLMSNVNSRNNSISTTFDINLVGSTNNSGANSRRSSIAPDFFPNPLKEIPQHKRNISSNSLKAPGNGLTTTVSNGSNTAPQPLALNQPFSFHPLTSISNSPTQQTFNLNKSNPNLSNVLTSSNLNPNSPKVKDKGDKDKVNDTKISVSSLID